MPETDKDERKSVRLFERARQFILHAGEFNYEKALKEYEQFGSLVDLSRSKFQADAQLQFRDIPMMLQDPIIAACLSSMMETAFQPTHDQNLIQANSRYPKLADILNGWHKEIGMDSFALIIAYNLGLYGNLPVKMYYNKQTQLERFAPVADFLSIIPIVVSNRTIGYYVNGEYVDFHEYVYAQYLHYKDLGGTRNPMFKLTQRPGDTEQPLDLQNEFVLAPSYLSAAVRPWRNIRLIEDVLVLQRMDQSNFLRIVGVNVGDNITSKNAMRMLNFYRAIFKKARRVPFGEYGMASSSFGNEFEVVVPTSAKQNLDIKDIGGQIEVRALRDLDVQYQRLFTALRTSPSIVGFTEDTPSSLGEGPTTVWNNNHARTAKVFQFSALRAIKQIDLLYLRSRGYDVSDEDWTLTAAAASTIEEESKRKSIMAGLDVYQKAFEVLKGSGLPFNKEYLGKELLQQAFAAAPLDMAQLFDTENIKNTPQPAEENPAALLTSDRLKMTSILLEEKAITPAIFSAYKLYLEGQKPEAGAANLPVTKLLTSDGMSQRVMAYNEFIASGFLASTDESRVDISTIDKTLVVGSVNRDTFVPFRNGKPQNLPTAAIAITEDQKKMSSKTLLSGAFEEIEAVYLIENRYYFPNEQDLANYIYIASSGMDKFSVKKVYVKS